METNMIMNYEEITPETAANWLESNSDNRRLSKPTIAAYASDMLSGNFKEEM